MVRALVLVKAPKTLAASEIAKVEGIKYAFDVSGRFDAAALVEVGDLKALKEAVLKIQRVRGVRRTETLVEF